MTQRLSTFICISLFFISGLALAEPTNSTGNSAITPSKKKPEAYFIEGLNCLKQQDNSCAQLALNSIPSQSAYAKLLAGNLAAQEGNTDRAFRLLLPLQADSSLSPTAVVSLHASLALAYEKQGDPARALEQLVITDDATPDGQDKLDNQAHILQLLSGLTRDDLIEMRGESLDTTTQGWIDLALAIADNDESNQATSAWRNAYPEHPAMMLVDKQFAKSIIATEPNPNVEASKTSIKKPLLKGLHGKIALILPFGVDAFYPVADAIQQGVVKAQAVLQGDAEIQIYSTTGSKDQIAAIYQQATSDGANYVIGPLTRDEVTELSSKNIPVPTLALNQTGAMTSSKNFHTFGLFIEGEAAQVAKIGRDAGMQTATIILTETVLANRIAKAFGDAWLSNGGQVKMILTVAQDGLLDEIKSKISANPADMIFVATTAEETRIIRPYLDAATPTYGLSYVYAGIDNDSADKPLNAVRFVDMPWLLNPDDENYVQFKPDAADLPLGEMQRWYAVGADAYQLLAAIGQQQNILHGLSGKLQITETGEISRDLALGRFSAQGIALDMLP